MKAIYIIFAIEEKEQKKCKLQTQSNLYDRALKKKKEKLMAKELSVD